MDFRLPQPVKYSLKKKKRRWKALREETKKLSLKNHKRNASCQTDSSESSESSSVKKSGSQRVEALNVSSENYTPVNSVERDNLTVVPVYANDGQRIHSVYHYCTPARRKMVKDISHRSYDKLQSSVAAACESTTEEVTHIVSVKESSSVLTTSIKVMENGTIVSEKDKKPARKQSYHFKDRKRGTSPSSSIKTATSERISRKNEKELTSVKDSTGTSPFVGSNCKSKPSHHKVNSTILLTDSETSISSASGNLHNYRSPSTNQVPDNKENELDFDKNTSSDMSQLVLDSSVSSGERNILTKNLGPSTNKLQTGLKQFPRSSVLNKRFNKVVESDFAHTCNISDFYLRVKRRVLGLHNSNSAQESSDHSSGIIFEENEDDCNIFKKSDVENSNRSSPKDSIRGKSSELELGENEGMERLSSSTSTINKIKEINETISTRKAAELNSPEIVLRSDDSFTPVKGNLSDKTKKRYAEGAVLCSRKKFVSPESSDSENTPPPATNNPRFRREKMMEQKKPPGCNVEPVKTDSELSSSSGGIEYRRKRAVFVIGSSDSESSVRSKSDDVDNVDLINDFHESDLDRMHESDEKESVCSQEKELVEVGEILNSGSSDLFRHVTKRALVLDSYESTSTGEKQLEVVAVQASSPKNENEVFNMLYKPGFSTLSQSKHEDIKKWLNTIPCSGNDSSVDLKKTADSVVQQEGDDDIKLTDMEQVLNELYGNDWGDKKKFIPTVVPKKKESQIIIARLTDSDDSSTPPLPPSTPKRKLYNTNFFTPTETLGKRNIFTPITAIGKKGTTNLFRTPKTVGSKSKTSRMPLGPDTFSSPVLTFVASLSVSYQSVRCHPEAQYFVKNFKSKKEELARKLFHMFNSEVFSTKLPHDLPLLWNNRLRKTAGYCYNRRIKNSDGTFTRTSRVELSSKIVDNTARLRDTLIHELCHAATWIISEVTGGHGPTWKRWTNKAMEAFPELPPISRCHNYDIVTKYKYKCSSCNYSIGRHSKSLDVQRKVCGICGGKFELFLNSAGDSGKPVAKTPRTPNAFALFVKENYGSAKKSKENLKHKDVMMILSEQFAATKITATISEDKDC